MTNTLTIRSHDELISFIPHTLGFTPESSMVCLALGGGPTSRLDLPDPAESMATWVHQLSDVYLHRHHTNRLALIAYGEDGRACVEALAALGDALVNSEVRGPGVGPMLWVNGDQWVDVLEGNSGTVDPGTRARIDAEFALMGRVMPAGRREDLAAAMQGDPTGVAEHLPAAQERALEMNVSTRTAEVEWLGSRLDEFLRDRKSLSDVDAARVLAVIHDSGARDAAETRMSRENAPVFSEFWHQLVRRAPDEVRDTPAAMLALSSYLEGKGAQAWVALDQISESHPPLADLVATALEQAIDPREWERALHPAASGVLMQQAALRETAVPGRRPQDQAAHHTRGVDAVDPDASAPGR